MLSYIADTPVLFGMTGVYGKGWHVSYPRLLVPIFSDKNAERCAGLFL